MEKLLKLCPVEPHPSFPIFRVSWGFTLILFSMDGISKGREGGSLPNDLLKLSDKCTFGFVFISNKQGKYSLGPQNFREQRPS